MELLYLEELPETEAKAEGSPEDADLKALEKLGRAPNLHAPKAVRVEFRVSSPENNAGISLCGAEIILKQVIAVRSANHGFVVGSHVWCRNRRTAIR